jgi:aldose 1-epimerase
VSRYAVSEGTREGEATLRLQDEESGAVAEVWPGCGFNCFALALPAPERSGAPRAPRAPRAPQETVTVVQAPPSLAEIRRRPSWWGVPLLFPFPGVVPDGEYVFGGRRLRLGRSDQPVVAEGHEAPGARRNYHGFVMDAPWTVAEARGDDAGAEARGTLEAAAFPEMLEGFPFPFRVAATYRLDGDGLHLRFRAENPGSGDLPCGFGAHPFFRVPLGPRGTPGECLVHIPAARRWDQHRVQDVLSGDLSSGNPPGSGAGEAGRGGGPREALVSWDDVCPPVAPELDLRTPRPFVEGVYNGLYADLERQADGWIGASVRDPANRREAFVRASPGIENIVFWSPPGRPELCLEPWSCPSNVFNLAAGGVPHNGLTILAPGGVATWEVSLGLRALAD